MASEQRATTLALFLVLTGALASCGPAGPCYGLELGRRYRISIVEPYTEESRFTKVDSNSDYYLPCEFSNLEPGDALDIQVVGMDDSKTCRANDGRLISSTKQRSLLDGLVGGSPLPITDAQTVFTIRSRFQFGDCPGEWQLLMEGHISPTGDEGNPFKMPMVGEVPPVTLHETFRGDRLDPQCVAIGLANKRCASQYVGSFQKLP